MNSIKHNNMKIERYNKVYLCVINGCQQIAITVLSFDLFVSNAFFIFPVTIGERFFPTC